VTETREVWITGVGLVTCLVKARSDMEPSRQSGDRAALRRQDLCAIHRASAGPDHFDKQFRKRAITCSNGRLSADGSRRGLALADAGIAGKPDLLDGTDMMSPPRRRA